MLLTIPQNVPSETRVALMRRQYGIGLGPTPATLSPAEQDRRLDVAADKVIDDVVSERIDGPEAEQRDGEVCPCCGEFHD